MVWKDNVVGILGVHGHAISIASYNTESLLAIVMKSGIGTFDFFF
jgi:hypothetical protein